MFSFLIKAKNILLDIFFPPFCLNCQKHLNVAQFLCNDCFGAIKLNSAPFCPVCRKRLAENKICRHGRQRFSYLLLAASSYDDPILKNLIHYYKYKSFKNLTPLLGEIIIKYINSLSSKFCILNSVIVPIPLYPSRERKRGFNQAKLLAEFVGQKLNLELAAALKKIKNIKPQAQLKSGEERIKNIEGCFGITNPEFVKNKNIILIDDVFTSGATMNEAVKTLKQNGARKIIALVLARA